MKKPFSIFAIVALAVMTLSSCSKKDKDDPAPKAGRTLKVTFSGSGVSTADHDLVLLQVGGSDYKQTKTLLKLNGVPQTNEPIVKIDEKQLIAGGTYTIESLVPLDVCYVSLTALNLETAFNVKLKIEVDGKTIIDLNQTVANSFDKTYDL
ncbi:hypothetical protein [Chitinophaga solisilvae]|uniref:Uncharacterized protein n=1 Tax=Chitinophaga solisilvae TaxID=1233460 RepID=A0A433WGP5_9BACT|nr:hypothetical protein [Chitinophaga solisilvae]NSL85785.1 hypothetical protein [Chitinophaga solisilvae]